ncbi:hypothetical protein MSG28_007407 [Choristoneura fumiferana]|uniref:Uncharacterized protein n=1 Tax=Choristoneura fumiferana TaxID=7141 RepID=A0ACC0JWY5_CHOFU|nr:hypothetical protein MSG28_007407 [Choristoneura fumiferana]
MSFLNKVVLITGAGSGIGEATAVRFAKASANLVLADLRGETVTKSAEKCAKISKQKAIPITADVSKTEDLKRIVDTTLNEFGKIDVVIHSAGLIILGGNITDPNLMENFDNTMSVNLRAIVELTHLAAPALIESKGNVVVVSSENALKVRQMMIPYAVSKAAVSHFTRCAALDLAPQGVRVNAVLPAPIITNLGTYAGIKDEDYQKGVDLCPLKAKLETHDVAELIFFLAGDTAKAITGVNYPVDAGSLLVT